MPNLFGTAMRASTEQSLVGDGFWPEARDRRDSPKLSNTGSSKLASDCFREHERNGARGQ